MVDCFLEQRCLKLEEGVKVDCRPIALQCFNDFNTELLKFMIDAFILHLHTR